MELTKVTEHVYWLPPGPPDRPSLCAVTGDRWTLLLDARLVSGNTRTLLDGLAAAGSPVPRPSSTRTVIGITSSAAPRSADS